MNNKHGPPIECFTDDMFEASNELDRLFESKYFEDLSIKERTFEILPGLRAELSKESIIQSADGGELLIVAKDVNIFFGRDLVFKGEGIHLKGKISNDTTADYSGKVTRTIARDLVVSIAHIIIDPLTDRDQLARFHQNFGVASLEEQNNKTVPDVDIPNIEVRAIKCEVSCNELRKDIDFPACEGNEGCTLRILIEYYMQSILNTLDILSGKKADISTTAITADIASAKTSVIGSVIGGAILGPVGFVAGSFIGANLGRKCSSSVVGGMAGAALFGPVGMVVGAAAGSEILQDSPQETSSSSQKYDTAGSTGAWAGTIAGASAGSVLGPLGVVGGAVTGAVAGSVSGRKVVEKGGDLISSGKEARGAADDESYKFGDFTRGIFSSGKNIVSSGKEARGATADEDYKFGDFTRGLWRKK